MRAESGALVVCWIQTPFVHIEFHVTQRTTTDRLTTESARIRSAVIRFRGPDRRVQELNTLLKIARHLARLPFLETIVLETGPQTAVSDAVVDAFRDAGTAEVVHRTCEQARQLQAQAEGGARLVDLQIVSPFWSRARRGMNIEWSNW